MPKWDRVAQGVTEALRHGLTADQRDRLLAEGRAMSAEAAAEAARAVVDGVAGWTGWPAPPERARPGRRLSSAHPRRPDQSQAGGAAGTRSG